MNILATGMVSAVGFSAAASCAAIRAKVAGMRELPILHLGGSEVVGAAVPDVAVDPDARLVDLLSIAIEDCLGKAAGGVPERLPIVLGVGEPGRPGVCGNPRGLIAQVEKRLGVRFHETLSTVVERGNAAGFHALALARKLPVPMSLVCAVDSYINAPALHWLERGSRLKTPENPDGVIPGEGAAALLVEGAAQGGGRGALPTNTRVLGLGWGTESAHVLSEEPILGLGLAKAALEALGEARLQMQEMDFRVSDVSGESYAFKEQALALARTLKVRKEELPIWHCAESIGDTGAAAGICQLVVVSAAFGRGYAPGDRAICYTSSVSGDRAVAVVGRAEQALARDRGGSRRGV